MTVARRGSTTLEGVLVVDKPAGMTSHDVIEALRRATGEGRLGHAGTLDPLATGVLVVLIGPYTRLEPYLSAQNKRYEVEIVFGVGTDTDDADGQVVERCDVPDGVFEAEVVHAALEGIRGVHRQVPPAYSAIKRNGEAAHRLARRGQTPHLEARLIEVYEATPLAVDAEHLTWRVALTVSKGTYVRAIARDLGRAFGICAHVRALRRTASGHATLEHAHSLDEIIAAFEAGAFDDILADPFVLLGLPVLDAPRSVIRDGRPITLQSGTRVGSLLAVRCDGRLSAIYRSTGDRAVPQAVFPFPHRQAR